MVVIQAAMVGNRRLNSPTSDEEVFHPAAGFPNATTCPFLTEQKSEAFRISFRVETILLASFFVSSVQFRRPLMCRIRG